MTYKSSLFLLTFLLFAMHISAQDMYKVTADKLRVRETNSTDSKIIGFIPQNENVQVLDSTDAKYFKVKVTNGEGWVSSEFLTRVSPPPIKKVQTQAPIVQPKIIESNSNTTLVIIIAIVLIAMLFLIFKFLINNKILMIFSAIVVLAIGYLCFSMFLVQKTVSGKFTSDSDTQYLTFDFKSKDSVVIQDTYVDSLFTAPYTIEGDMIKFKQQENTILLMIRDNQTLIGEGFTKGVYNKN